MALRQEQEQREGGREEASLFHLKQLFENNITKGTDVKRELDGQVRRGNFIQSLFDPRFVQHGSQGWKLFEEPEKCVGGGGGGFKKTIF